MNTEDKMKTNKTRAKAKSQKIVSRAVKQAGFKNIKEAKAALKREKVALSSARDAIKETTSPSDVAYEALKNQIKTLIIEEEIPAGVILTRLMDIANLLDLSVNPTASPAVGTRNTGCEYTSNCCGVVKEEESETNPSVDISSIWQRHNGKDVLNIQVAFNQ